MNQRDNSYFRKSYGQRTIAGMLAILCVALLSGSFATAQTPLCLYFEALDSPGEVEASPRQDENAELLTLMASRGVAADSSLYERVQVDLDWIETLRPDLAAIHVHASPLADSLIVVFDSPATLDVARAGEIADFECLNELFDLRDAFWSITSWVAPHFDGRYKTETVIEAYEQIPGVTLVEGNNMNSIFDDIGCFYRDSEGRRVYFYEEYHHSLLVSYSLRLVRAEITGSDVVFEDYTPPYDSSILEEYTDCKAGLLDMAPLVEIPTLSGPALSMLALFLALAALRASAKRRSLSMLR